MSENEKKKILVVDDSALMRRVICDIINSDRRFQVVAKAVDGVEAFDLMSRESYDAVVLDINMPRMNGIEVLRELRKYKIKARIMIASTDSKEGASVTMDALELGALDFIQKPGTSFECRNEAFTREFLDTLYAVSIARMEPVSISGPAPKRQEVNIGKPDLGRQEPKQDGLKKTEPRHDILAGRQREVKKPEVPVGTAAGAKTAENRPKVQIPTKTISTPTANVRPKQAGQGGRKVVAIASSTGGPRALQSLIPKLPKGIDAPILLVQHMPKGFTASLAERLDNISEVTVKEAREGEILEKGTVYVAMGGQHFNIRLNNNGSHSVHYTDEPTREGVKPCANYMYESLIDSKFTDILCVVMTGMGADGTEGIINLKNGCMTSSKGKNISVLTQNQSSCVVYGMPKSAVQAGLSDAEVELEGMAVKIADWAGR